MRNNSLRTVIYCDFILDPLNHQISSAIYLSDLNILTLLLFCKAFRDQMSDLRLIKEKMPPTLLITLKFVSTIFYKIFIFSQMIALQKPWKMFFISSKKLFSFSSSIALEVDPRKGTSLRKNHAENLHQKLAPDPFLILLKNPNSHWMQIFLKIKYFERERSKSLKKVSFIFLSNPISFNGQSYQKQNGPGTSHQSLFRSQNKFRKILLFVIYYLTKFDDVL